MLAQPRDLLSNGRLRCSRPAFEKKTNFIEQDDATVGSSWRLGCADGKRNPGVRVRLVAVEAFESRRRVPDVRPAAAKAFPGVRGNPHQVQV